MTTSTASLVLLPAPRSLVGAGGAFSLAGRFIRLGGTAPQPLLPAGRAAGEALCRATGRAWSIIAGDVGPDDGVGVTIRIADGLQPQGYRLTIASGGVTIDAADPAGAFYAAQTLTQIIRQCPAAVPALTIEDWPDFPARGVMLDISRDKVPTMATLHAIVDQLAEWKINQFQLYTEHTFAYRGHDEVWCQASPMTGAEIIELDEYCRRRFVDLVPNQNSFGHMERWLSLPEYRPMADAADGFEFPWGGRSKGPTSLYPDEKSVAFVAGLYDQLLPHFSSGLFNIGCDETWDLGQGRSKALCEQRGRHRVYLDFLLKIYELARRRGRTPMFWGDIILHEPKLIVDLPRDMIALEWGYEADHPFSEHGQRFADAGVPFYVCPGTSSWNTIAGRTDNAVGNLRSAAENGLRCGAIGYLNTDWGDNGHMQPLPASSLGYAVGAAMSWCLATNTAMPVAAALSRHAFRDAAGVMGQVAFDLGNVYQKVKRRKNASALFHLLTGSPDDAKLMDGITANDLSAAEEAIRLATAPLDSARMDRPDAGLIIDEFRHAAALLTHACHRGQWMLQRTAHDPARLAAELRQSIGAHRRLWLARNREGGLRESVARLEKSLAGY